MAHTAKDGAHARLGQRPTARMETTAPANARPPACNRLAVPVGGISPDAPSQPVVARSRAVASRHRPTPPNSLGATR